MGVINNGNVSNAFTNDLGLQLSADGKALNQNFDAVMPTYDYQNTLFSNVIASGFASNAVTKTLLTTPTDKDFFMTACQLSVIKDATSTSTSVDIECMVGGKNFSLIAIPCISLTAQTGQISLSFPVPIKVDRNSAITINSSTNVANITYFGSIVGYLKQTTVSASSQGGQLIY